MAGDEDRYNSVRIVRREPGWRTGDEVLIDERGNHWTRTDIKFRNHTQSSSEMFGHEHQGRIIIDS